MAFANFNIAPTNSQLTAGGSGLFFNAPALPNLSAFLNRLQPKPENDDWKWRYQMELNNYNRGQEAAAQESAREDAKRMQDLQLREMQNRIAAREQGPVKRFTTFGGGVINGWTPDTLNMNAYQREAYLPGASTTAPEYPSIGQQSEARQGQPVAPAAPEDETPLNSRRLNDMATGQRASLLTADMQRAELQRQIAALMGSR